MHESSQVHRCNERVYDRNEDADIDITDHTSQVAQLYRRKETTYSENRVYPVVRLEAVWRKAERKSAAGRKPWDAVLMFKAIVLGSPYNLSDEALEHEMGDRLTFMRFLGLGLEDRIPDATTVWLYRERLAKAGIVEKLFERFDEFLRRRGYRAMGGQIVDASIVPVPTQRNSREENAEIKEGRHSCGLGGGIGQQAGPEGLGRAVDEEEGGEPLRLQEPRVDGPAPQAGAALRGDGRGHARHPSSSQPNSTSSGRPQSPSSSVPASCRIRALPCGATTPCSARWPRSALIVCVRWRTSRSRV